MILQLYEYICHCSNKFKFPHLLCNPDFGEPYGEFLLKSELNEILYLNSFGVREFDELSELLKKNPKLKK